MDAESNRRRRFYHKYTSTEETSAQVKSKGFNAYKQHWEDQASFMDKAPWDRDKILKLTLSSDFDDNLKELQFI